MGIEIAPGTKLFEIDHLRAFDGAVGLKRVLGQSSDFLDAVCCQN
jgi:hypothetical protein